MTKNKIIVSLSIALFAFVGFSGNIAMAQTVTGSGTPNYLPLWTSTSSIGNSVMYQSTSNIGIGTTAPNDQLEITGNFRLPITTSTAGVIKLGVVRFLHAYGNSNTFLGSTAGNLTMSSMGDNVGIGTNVLTANTTGYWNTSVGSRSLQANTTGYENTAIGERSLFYDTVGYQNTAAGSKTLYLNISGAGNSAFGYAALKNNSTGGGNSAFGYNALYSTNGDRNVAVGGLAGMAVSGSDNIFLGYAAGDNVYSGDNNIIIGSNIDAPLPNGGNQMYLGGVIYGDLLNKKIGIGTTIPSSKLEIENTTGNSLTIKNAGTAVFNVDRSGVIGTGADGYLSSGGMVIGYQNMIYGSSQNGGVIDMRNQGMTVKGPSVLYKTLELQPVAQTGVTTEIPIFLGSAHTITITGGFANQRDYKFLGNTITAASALTVDTAATVYIEKAPVATGSASITYPYALFIDDGDVRFDGNVGIGAITPAQKLEVNGGMRLNTATAKPACDSSVRGTFWATQGASGVKDSVEVCAKDAADSYAWRTLY